MENRQFDEFYRLINVKYNLGWEGFPTKMSKAIGIVSGNWQQVIITHVCNITYNLLNLGSTQEVDNQVNQIKITEYNDFDNLFWLGNKVNSNFIQNTLL